MIRLLAALALLVTAPAPLLAQEPTPEQVQALMAEAVDDLVAAGRLLEGDPAAADRAAADERLEAACAKYAEALALVARVDVPPEGRAEVEQIAHYNTACARALQGRPDEALDAFARALDAGYVDFGHIERDPDLDPIRSAPRYAQLLERARARVAQAAREAAEEVVSDEPLFPFDFDVTTLDGQTLRLEELRGKVVIVDFWGTWCEPCRAEIPNFVALQEELGDRLMVVGLAWERGAAGEEVEAKVRRVGQDLGVNYPLAMASPALLRRVPDLNAFPTTLFIDKHGRVRAREVGYRDLGVLRSLFLALDAEPGPEEQERQDRAF